MQNLRDQLLKSGIVSKKQKQQVEQEKRRTRKQQGKGLADESVQAQQRQAYEAKLEAQRQADQQRAEAQRAQLEEHEKRLQIRQVIDYWQAPEDRDGSRRWYFVTPKNIIKYLDVAEPTALQLSAGALAIVEHPEEAEPHYVLVAREAAEVIARVEPRYIRFHNTVSAETESLF